MTLIQTLVNPTYVLQVSDRRLTKGNKLYDARFNKAIVWEGCMTVAFTGFAYADPNERMPMSIWIARQLQYQDTLQGAMQALQIAATKLTYDLAKYWDKRKLSIVIAGIPPGANFAYVGRVSNYEDLDSRATKQWDHFVVNQHLIPLNTDAGFYLTSGVQLRDSENDYLMSRLAQVSEHGINNVARLLVSTQRRVSARSTTVSSDAMIVSIPEKIHPLGAILTDSMSDSITDAVPNFSYVQPHSFDPHRIAPLMVGNGNIVRMSGGYNYAQMQFVRVFDEQEQEKALNGNT